MNKWLTIALAATAAACGDERGQNVVITNEIPANADVEVLPPDESAATPSNQLENGVAQPNVDEPSANAS